MGENGAFTGTNDSGLFPSGNRVLIGTRKGKFRGLAKPSPEELALMIFMGLRIAVDAPTLAALMAANASWTSKAMDESKAFALAVNASSIAQGLLSFVGVLIVDPDIVAVRCIGRAAELNGSDGILSGILVRAGDRDPAGHILSITESSFVNCRPSLTSPRDDTVFAV
jgi:hypothetical protein